MTKTKPGNRKPSPYPGRLVTFAEDARLVGLAAKLADKSQPEFVRDHLRPAVRAFLKSRGFDPDAILAAGRK